VTFRRRRVKEIRLGIPRDSEKPVLGKGTAIEKKKEEQNDDRRCLSSTPSGLKPQ